MAIRVFLSALAGVAVAWVAATTSAIASPRPATLDDVLAMQTFASASLSPDGRWAVWERRAAYDTAPRFDRGVRSGVATTTLHIAAVAGGEAEPLLPAGDGPGLLLGPWSPDAARLVVYRWRGDTLELGIIDISGHSVRWTGLTPDLGISGVAAAWTSRDRLAVTVRPAGDLPWPFRFENTGRRVTETRWLRTAEGKAPSRTAFETADGAAQVEDEPQAPFRLVLLDAATGGQRLLYEGAIRDMAPSPDGRRLAVLETSGSTALPAEERPVHSAILTRGRLALIDIASGVVVRPAPALDVAPHLLRWSPDSRRVLAWTRQDGRAWRQGALVAFGATGRVETFASDQLSPSEVGRAIDELRPVRADWLGEQPIVYARDAAGRFDWWALGRGEPVALTRQLEMTPSHIAANDHGASAMIIGDGDVWTMTLRGLSLVSDETAGLRDADPGDARTALRLRVNSAPLRDWVPVSDGAMITSIDNTGRQSQRSPLPLCTGSARTLSAVKGAVLRLCLERGLERLDLVTAAGNRVMDQLNAEFGVLASAQAIPHRDKDGRPTQTYLYLPPDRSASAVKGLIVHLYPGGGDDGRHVDGNSLHMGPRPQVLAMGGYAVLSVSIASERESRRSEMFDDFAHGVDLAVEAALAAAPDLPGDRIAIVGHSFGGYAALGIATRSQRYRAYAAWASPTDMIGKWGELLPQARTWPEEGLSLNQSMGSVETGQTGLGAPPWAAINAYVAASPALLAQSITAPVLLITADRDYVPMSQAERMFTALHRLGKPARLVIYWGEGHDNASPANIRDAYREIFTWLDRALILPATSEPPRP